ncbi:alpha/beta hydrolase family protein [Sphingomonas glaciei]|uniref:Alpha/beta hydrolase n=1 Tax=Sphingomonas glaciei TaxID=2938948 RepID=A0ABY5MUG1_9SPHN|nr:alpha/beta fold hydrolase [Sphingomonas glaciei]UUR07054.1 alpha/beta hydrolase [Sphingomonas glaciei]
MALSRDDSLAPPGYRRFTEALSLAPRLLNGFGHLGPRGPVDGPPALVIPGFVATDRTTLELRRAFAEAGFRTHPWALGLNRGARADTLERLERRLVEIGDGGQVLVIGWSLGGLFARELARHRPDLVSAVVTLGSPFSGDLRANNVWRLYELVAGHKVDNPPLPRIPDKPPVPTLTFWSRRDGIVAPACARGQSHESDERIELNCNHMAFGVSRKATREVVRETKRFLEGLPR